MERPDIAAACCHCSLCQRVAAYRDLPVVTPQRFYSPCYSRLPGIPSVCPPSMTIVWPVMYDA
jgi:hypothetical protein